MTHSADVHNHCQSNGQDLGDQSHDHGTDQAAPALLGLPYSRLSGQDSTTSYEIPKRENLPDTSFKLILN